MATAVTTPTAHAAPTPDGLTAADWAAIQSFLPSDYLKASNTGAGDEFGYTVAVSGDTVVVGAHLEESAATGVNGDQADNSVGSSGAAYVFTRTAGVWSQQAYLKASNTDTDDRFGIAVAVSGDTVVVGALLEDSNATGVNGNQANNSAADSGAVYIFGGCRRSAQTGEWEEGDTWVGAVAPTDTDGVCIESGHTVTMNGNDAIDQLWVYQGGTLDLGAHTLTVEKSVSNEGTLRQTRTVNNANVEFLHIQNAALTITQYRGVMLDTSDNLGPTTVSVRELNLGEYCTNTGATSPAYARRCFDISPTPPLPPTIDVLVRLYGRTADELNGIAPASLAVYRNNPAGSNTWIPAASGAVGTSGAYSYAQANVTSFSPFLLGGVSSPTAVTLSTFSANSNLRGLTNLVGLLAMLILAGWVLHRRHVN